MEADTTLRAAFLGRTELAITSAGELTGASMRATVCHPVRVASSTTRSRR